MRQLRITGVTYLGTLTGQPRTEGANLILSKSGVSVLRGFRTLLHLQWEALTSLNTPTPQEIRRKSRTFRLDYFMFPGLTDSTASSPGALLGLGNDKIAQWLVVPGMSRDELRNRLATWAVQAAGPGPVSRISEPGMDPAQLAFRAVGIWRAAGQGREPLTSRSTVAYRMSVAENLRLTGDIHGALALLESLTAQCIDTYGAADTDTLAVRNNLAYTVAVAGFRDEAIWLYWEILDDCGKHAELHKAETFAGRTLARLHDPHWRP
jgi:hypothetical protein